MNSETAASAKFFSVRVIDLAHYREEASEMLISGFASAEEAIDYARRRVRASVEELRSANQTTGELRKLWAIYGEDALVSAAGYAGSSELEHFINHQATAEQCDWQAMEKRLGAALQWRRNN